MPEEDTHTDTQRLLDLSSTSRWNWIKREARLIASGAVAHSTRDDDDRLFFSSRPLGRDISSLSKDTWTTKPRPGSEIGARSRARVYTLTYYFFFFFFLVQCGPSWLNRDKCNMDNNNKRPKKKDYDWVRPEGSYSWRFTSTRSFSLSHFSFISLSLSDSRTMIGLQSQQQHNNNNKKESTFWEGSHPGWIRPSIFFLWPIKMKTTRNFVKFCWTRLDSSWIELKKRKKRWRTLVGIADEKGSVH